jgi:hypothetical protein
LILVRFDQFSFAAEIEALPEKIAREIWRGIGIADARRFAIWEAGHADRAAQAVTSRDFRIHVNFSAFPKTRAQKQRAGVRRPKWFVRSQAVWARVRREEAIVELRDAGRLKMDGPIFVCLGAFSWGQFLVRALTEARNECGKRRDATKCSC